jgi:CRISPR system Cascade subunit CasE
MYISQLILNLRSRTARTDLADRYELHRTLLSAFPDTLPDDERILYRVEQHHSEPVASVLVQSQYIPDWESADRLWQATYLLADPQIRQILVEAAEGEQLPFRLQANPTVKRDGKRHAIQTDEQLLVWLQRKGEQHGFDVAPLDVRIVKMGKTYGKKRKQTWEAVQYDGRLRVVDSDRFVDVLRYGIGSAKAFGFGLLSIPYRDA